MAEEQDPEVPDVPEHDLSEEDMMFVGDLSNWPLPVLLWLFFAAPLPLLGPIII